MWKPQRNSSRMGFLPLLQLQSSQMLRRTFSSPVTSGSRIKSTVVAFSSNQMDVHFDLCPGTVAITAVTFHIRKNKNLSQKIFIKSIHIVVFHKCGYDLILKPRSYFSMYSDFIDLQSVINFSFKEEKFQSAPLS